jgi:hypothetical protein
MAGGVVDLQLHRDLRMLGDEASQQFAHQVVADRVAGAQAQLAAEFGAVGIDAASQFAHSARAVPAPAAVSR